MNLDRFETLVGSENLERIKRLNILIVGIGGVGGYTFETLVRSGVENITIVDGDVIDETNLNRQIITNRENIGVLKVVEASRRAKGINNKINVDYYNVFLDKYTIKDLNISDFDYVVDACDDVDAKELLIEEAVKNNVKVISSMGTARKMDASKIYVTTLDKTSYDPLARVMRKKIDKEIQKDVVVVSSKEESVSTVKLGSNSFVPAVAGVLITNYIINDVISKN